ncbi:unnamed protein product (macronuclear) [Paramecium tetraurelia]|uniref:Uncharacterized protein n=1 Tax=Paramecium tetraurelia TaxID=5888 RepID=A0DYE0_PARTE|nr:uncharacterized protein GSPATT00003025001 [Paramecium tetraurelia]CAK88057.1 unnamed protein product [Paramecium tetraurelia]|eukprot:XP_001455454.1 hypothetical protein (macronuclear) [Paramecium tetraurelia strain d4-2]
MSKEEQSQQNEQPYKRQRRPRQHTNEEESNQFWKNNQYFAQGQIDEGDDEDSEEYYPQQSSASEEISKENDTGDYIDSLDQWQDCSDSKVQLKQQQESPSKSFIKLMRKNLEQFSTMRGVHTQVDIATLPRLGETSYVYFNEEQKFKTEFQDVLNRFYKSIPYSKKIKREDDQVKCKTEFHGDLFDFEDKRYFIDIEIQQLQRILKLYKTQKFDSYLAYRKLTRDQNLDFQQSIQKQLDLLRQKKRQMDAQLEEEKRCFNLSIDQQYILKLKEYTKCLTPRYFQSQSNLKYEQLLLNENPLFQIYPFDKQPQWLLQYQETYKIFNQKFQLLQAPLYFYSFQDANALKIASHLILKSIKQLEQVSKNKFIAKIFVDLINALFNIDIPEADLLFNTELLNEEIIHILTTQDKQNLLNQPEQYKPFPTPDDPGVQTKTKLRFYPNFKIEEYALYGRPVFEFSMRYLYEIYLRIQSITQISTKITYKNIEYTIGNLIMECCYKYLEDEITYAAWLTICKSIFNEQDSIQFQSLILLVQMFRRLFYQYDEWTVELLINWIYKVLGDDSKIVNDDVQISNVSVKDILSKSKNNAELSNAKMTRVQTVDGLMIIHVFEFSQLY